MLDLCLTVLMGSLGNCVWEIGLGLPGLCIFLGNTSAGTGRVDISVQLLIGLVIHIIAL